MIQYGLIGFPIKHSKSPALYQALSKRYGFKIIYSLYPTKLEMLDSTLSLLIKQGVAGLNVTTPLKSAVLEYAEHISDRAKLAKGANLLTIKNGLISADNTDGPGFVMDLSRHTTIAGKRILVLGAGVAARSVILSLLNEQPAHIHVMNRTLNKAQRIVEDFDVLGRLQASNYDTLLHPYDIVINATSSSLMGNTPPVPSKALSNALCYDLAYGDLAKPFLQLAGMHSAAAAIDGSGMLAAQAALNVRHWFGIAAEVTV